MKQRWNCKKRILEDSNPKVDAFLIDIWAVCEKHGLCIGHEDAHGAFLVQAIQQANKDWLFEAHDDSVP